MYPFNLMAYRIKNAEIITRRDDTRKVVRFAPQERVFGMHNYRNFHLHAGNVELGYCILFKGKEANLA